MRFFEAPSPSSTGLSFRLDPQRGEGLLDLALGCASGTLNVGPTSDRGVLLRDRVCRQMLGEGGAGVLLRDLVRPAGPGIEGRSVVVDEGAGGSTASGHTETGKDSDVITIGPGIVGGGVGVDNGAGASTATGPTEIGGDSDVVTMASASTPEVFICELSLLSCRKAIGGMISVSDDVDSGNGGGRNIKVNDAVLLSMSSIGKRIGEGREGESETVGIDGLCFSECISVIS